MVANDGTEHLTSLHQRYLTNLEESTSNYDAVVVVVNYCSTSLFGTNGLLSDIVLR